MCLAVPGRIVEMLDRDAQLAKVDVGGVRRSINIGLIGSPDDPVREGDWVLIHVGFALSRIDEDEARATLDALEKIGKIYDDELADLHASRIE